MAEQDKAEDGRKNWKHISGEGELSQDRPPVATGQKRFHKANDNIWQAMYFMFRNEPYCVLPDGFPYQMVPMDNPTIGYKLVDTAIDKATFFSNSVQISEKQAMDKLFP